MADALFDIPLVTPPLVIGIGLLLLLGSQGPLAGNFPAIGAQAVFPVGVIIAQTLCRVSGSVPFGTGRLPRWIRHMSARQ